MPDFQHVFIVTYGRSGSTLLAGMLNSIEGWLIRGENGNFCYDLFKSYAAIRSAQAIASKTHLDSTAAYFGIHDVCLEDYRRGLRELARETLLSGVDEAPRVVGFKEIRYPKLLKDQTFEPYLDFLLETFPASAIVFNYRDLRDVMRSKWWSHGRPWERAKNKRRLREFEQRSQAYAAKNSNACFEINYADAVKQTSKLRDLFEFLGESYDPGALHLIATRKHSY